MKKLLTMNELTITEIEKILHEAEGFANGASWNPKAADHSCQSIL